MEGFVDKDDTSTMYGMIQFGRMYRTLNGANSINFIPGPGPGIGNWVTPFEQDPTETNTIYVGYDQVFKSMNRGDSWTPISQTFSSSLDEMKLAPTNNQVIYAANGVQFLRTRDGGATDWEQTTTPGGQINSIAVHPTNPDKVAVVTTSINKIFVTEDGGDTWENYRFNLPNFSSLSVAWDDNGEDGLYVGMDYGIYYIDNTFTEWQPYSTNLPNVIINELEVNVADQRLYAGSYGRGLWSSPLFIPEVLATASVNAATFSIVPNPTTTTFDIVLPTADQVDIRVFDIAGKLLMYLPNVEVQNRHTIDVSNLSQGTYFVRLGTSKGTVTQKLLKQ